MRGLTTRNIHDVVIVGAGAAGVMAAIFAAAGGANATLLETTRDGGRKILISGGGRCNVLPSTMSVARYVTASSVNSLKKMLLSWPLNEQKRYFEEDLGVPLMMEEETGKVFPVSNRARDIRDRLLGKAIESGVDVRFGHRVEEVEPTGAGWRVVTNAGEFRSQCVVMATGGLSVPQTGSDGHGFQILRTLGHTIHPTYPALTPLTASSAEHAALAGISLHVELSAPHSEGQFTTSGGFLFTHRGYSGPAVMDISHLAVRATNRSERPVCVRWGAIDDATWQRVLGEKSGAKILPIVRQYLPGRLAERLVAESGVDGMRPFVQLKRSDREHLLSTLTRYSLPWTGDEGYKKAEVTGGGVSLAEVRPDTMESRVVPHLFICGELLDAFGPIGGYNFAWAWATGRSAGRGAARATRDGAG